MITPENTKTVYDLLMHAEEEFAQKVFVRYEQEDLIQEKSYQTFCQDARAIIAWVQELSDEWNKPVHASLIGNASYEYIACMVAVMSAGGVAIPMDRQLSKEGLSDQINRSDSDVVFYDREFDSQVEVLKELCPDVKKFICIQKRKHVDNAVDLFVQYRCRRIEERARAEELACIIFTSGTTGRSKGVMLSHAALIDNVFCGSENPDLYVSLNVLPINHIFCLNGNVLLIMKYGHTICLTADLSKFIYYMQIFQPMMIRLVPMMAKLLYNRYLITKKQNPTWSEEEVKGAVFGSRLKRIAVGGAYLAEPLALNLVKLGFEVGQGYGMSECSPKISVPDYPRLEKIASVGHLVKGCQARIVDGELQVKSPSVMMGYYHDPEKTKESLTEDGWLCTGDLARIDDENFVYLTGRKKNLIILSNGENVSPEQIENHFEDDPLIADILVYGANDSIKAEVYPNYEYAQAQGITEIEEEVKKIVAKRNEELASYQKIAAVRLRKQPFQKTSSRKLIRPNYFDEQEETEKKTSSVKQPETEMQTRLVEVVSGVLGDGVFGVDDDLYRSGLDSFGSILLIADLEKAFGKSISFAELLEYNTIEKLESYFNTEQEAISVDYTKREVYPLTNMQKYFAYIIKGNTTGNLPFAFELSKSIDLPRLRDAILTVIDAHPGLRGIIKPMENGYYGLYRDDERAMDIPIVKLTEEDWKQVQPTLLKAFDYTADDNLIHVSLYETERAKYMFLDVAHLMGDGISMNIVMEDIARAYDGQPVEKEGEYSIYEFILEENARSETGVRQKSLQYYGELMDGLTVNRSILTKPVMTPYSVSENRVLRARFEELTRNKIAYFCQKNGISENALFITAFNYCIRLFSDEDNVFVNSIHSGRTDSRWARLVGPLFLTYYCRYDRVKHERVKDLLVKTASQLISTMKCSVATQRQGEMFFQFQGDILNAPVIGGTETKWLHQNLDSLPFHMQVMYDEKGYYYELRYWNNRFDSQSIRIFMHCFEEILKAIPEERSVRRLKKHLSEGLFPMHYSVPAGDLEYTLKTSLFNDVNSRDMIPVYILDEDDGRKKPYGAWGKLYVRDIEPKSYTDSIMSPYTPGTLYNTGIIARIMPDGRLNTLEETGRTVLTEGMIGRKYFDLKLLKETFEQEEGIASAYPYLVYNNETNAMKLIAEIHLKNGEGEAVKAPDTEALKEKLRSLCGDLLVPDEIREV